MSDLKDLLERGRAVVAKEITVAGMKATVHLRRITAGERHQLLKGHKIIRQGNANSQEFDLALNEEQRHQLVLFAAVTSEGKPYFKDIAEVRAADSLTISALYEAAASLDEGKEGPGKA